MEAFPFRNKGATCRACSDLSEFPALSPLGDSDFQGAYQNASGFPLRQSLSTGYPCGVHLRTDVPAGKGK
jgi:hypothetical protein